MAKRSKKKPVRSTADTSAAPDYTDPHQVEKMVKRFFDEIHSMMGNVPNHDATVYAQADYDPVHRKRRIAAAGAYTAKVCELTTGLCPDIPGVFYAAEEWAQLNALPLTTYDREEDCYSLLLGAVIWILDRLKETGRMDEAAALLSEVDDPGDDAFVMNVWDPCHSEAVMEATLAVLQQRTRDCTGLTPSHSKRKKRQSPIQMSMESRYFMDAYTAAGKQRQDVPSRRRFESLLALLDEASVSGAVQYFQDKLWEWVACYFRCRAVFQIEEQAWDRKATQFQDQIAGEIDKLTQQSFGQKAAPFAQESTLPGLSAPSGLPFGSSQSLLGSPIQLLMDFESESMKIDEELEDIRDRIHAFTTESLMFCSMPHERILQEYGQEIADIVASF